MRGGIAERVGFYLTMAVFALAAVLMLAVLYRHPFEAGLAIALLIALYRLPGR
jgi:hypothetical protein